MIDTIAKRSQNNSQLLKYTTFFFFLVLIARIIHSFVTFFPFLAWNFGSNERLLPFPTPQAYCRTSRINQRQVTQQLTKRTAKKRTQLTS